MKQERKYGLDIVRIIATLSVLSVHFFLKTNYYNTPLNSMPMRVQSIIRNFFMICVPLFILITGYLNNNKEYNKIFFKKLFNILIIWLFYSVIEYFTLQIINNTHTFNLKDLLFNVTSFNGCGYSWYIEMYIGLYFLSPIINNAFDVMNDKNKKSLVIISIITFVLPTVVNALFDNILHIPSWWISVYPLCYYITGKYIKYKNYNFKKKNLILLLIFTQLITFSLSFICKIEYNTLTTFISTCIIFLLLYNINIKKIWQQKVLKYFSSISLDIYLSSSLIDYIIYKIFNNQMIIHNISQSKCILFAPLVILTVFILSSMMGSIRKLLINVR